MPENIANVEAGESEPKRAIPVSEAAARLAMENTVGSLVVIDFDKFITATENLIISRPTFARAIDRFSFNRDEMLRRQGFMREQYQTGAFLYYAAVREEAKLKGITSPKVALDDLTTVMYWQFDQIGRRDVLDRLKAMFDEAPTSAPVPSFYDTSYSESENMRRMQAAYDASSEAYTVIFSENAEENAKTLEDIEAFSRQALNAEVNRFLVEEENFVSVMNELGWTALPKEIRDSQLTGATDAACLVAAAYARKEHPELFK